MAGNTAPTGILPTWNTGPGLRCIDRRKIESVEAGESRKKHYRISLMSYRFESGRTRGRKTLATAFKKWWTGL